MVSIVMPILRNAWKCVPSEYDPAIWPKSLIDAAFVALTVAAWYRDRPAFAALAAAVLTLATMPAVYVVLNYVASGQFFTPWFRYGFSMMPFVATAREKAEGGS